MERERIAIGDTETIYRRLYPGLVRLAFLLTGSADEAHDLTHDVFVRMAGRLDALDDPDRYLRVSLVNAVRSAHRRRLVAERHQLAGPPDSLVDLELIEFRDALQLLPTRQRIAICCGTSTANPTRRSPSRSAAGGPRCAASSSGDSSS